MKIIVTHSNPDYDALASLALAKLLHPEAIIVIQGGINQQLEAFVQLYRDQLKLSRLDAIKLTEVKELIIVDSSDPERISPFDTLLAKLPITLYDHHPRPDYAIPAVRGRHQAWGATASILTLLLKARAINIPQAIASLALLGIHDDTGNLSYPLTQAEDYEAAAHLLRSGASLDFIQHYIHERYSPEHRLVFVKILKHATEHQIAERTVVISSFEHASYVSGLAPLCNQLLSFYGADAAFLVVRMQEKTLLIGRSQGLFQIAAVLAEVFSGGGHPGAGFAQTDMTPELAVARLLDVLPNYYQGLPLAKDIMTSPVRTISEDSSVSEAQSIMMRFGYNGLPVLSAEGILKGMITRRNLDKASQHQLSNVPVKACMISNVITASEDSSLSTLEQLIERHSIGRIPIMRGENIMGIVTRTDIIRARHQPEKAGLGLENLLDNLPYASRDLLEAAKHLALEKVYLVGGTVRDLLLGVDIKDLDISVEGMQAAELAHALQAEFGGKLLCHEDFATCKLELANSLLVDIATVREEYYQHPGALPVVYPGSLQKDLARRDFTLNALAIRLKPAPLELLDPFAGVTDLQNKTLRVLHPLSFIEDPTRILRGARLAGRLGLQFSEDNRSLIATALEPAVLHRVSPGRLRAELELTLQETLVLPALQHLEELNALSQIFSMSLPESWIANLDNLKYQEPILSESYLLALLMSIPKIDLEPVLTRFSWPQRYLLQAERLHKLLDDGDLSKLLSKLSPEEKQLVQAFGPAWREKLLTLTIRTKKPAVTGKEILNLGLAPGPAVGRVLAKIAKLRDTGQLRDYQEELELARQLVAAELAKKP